MLVAPQDVAGIPNGQERAGDNDELASDEESASGVVSIVGEEGDEEGHSNEVWHKENDSNKHIPPVVTLVQKAVEYFGEDCDEECDGEDSDADHTALNWEASEALQVHGLLNGAVANAAAAKATLLLLGQILEGLLDLLGFFFSGFHEWGVFHHSFAHHVHVFGSVFH